MKTSSLARFPVVFNYNQILVYDASVPTPRCVWTDTHCNQGFARRESTVCFDMILQYGEADVTVHLGPYIENSGYHRVIAVPFFSPTGRIIVQAILETYVARVLFLPKGYYKLYAAQRVSGGENEDHELLDFFFDKLDKPATHSD